MSMWDQYQVYILTFTEYFYDIYYVFLEMNFFMNVWTLFIIYCSTAGFERLYEKSHDLMMNAALKQ